MDRAKEKSSSKEFKPSWRPVEVEPLRISFHPYEGSEEEFVHINSMAHGSNYSKLKEQASH